MIRNDDERFIFLAVWAARQRASLVIDGEVGLGRPCVGISVSNHYIDFSDVYKSYPKDVTDPFFEAIPKDAYHKHECLAVLGTEEESFDQLYHWVKWLDEHGWTVEIEDRHPTDEIDLLIHGLTTPRLVNINAHS